MLLFSALLKHVWEWAAFSAAQAHSLWAQLMLCVIQKLLGSAPGRAWVSLEHRVSLWCCGNLEEVHYLQAPAAWQMCTSTAFDLLILWVKKQPCCSIMCSGVSWVSSYKSQGREQSLVTEVQAKPIKINNVSKLKRSFTILISVRMEVLCVHLSAVCILLYAGKSWNKMAIFYSCMSDFNHAMLGKMKVQEKLDANLFMGVGKRICCFFKWEKYLYFLLLLK